MQGLRLRDRSVDMNRLRALAHRLRHAHTPRLSCYAVASFTFLWLPSQKGLFLEWPHWHIHRSWLASVSFVTCSVQIGIQ